MEHPCFMLKGSTRVANSRKNILLFQLPSGNMPMLHYHSLSQYKLCKLSPFFTRFGFVPAQLFAQLPIWAPAPNRRVAAPAADPLQLHPARCRTACHVTLMTLMKRKISGNLWKSLEISGNLWKSHTIYTMKRQNTALSPMVSV